MMPIRYNGTPDQMLPPNGPGWAHVTVEDDYARDRAPSMLGALPLWHYQDEQLPSGLYRFFAFEKANGGTSIAAIKLVGDGAGTLGAPFDPGTNTPNGNLTVATADAIGACSGGFKALVDGVDSWPYSMTQDAVAYRAQGASVDAYVYTDDTPGPGLYQITTAGNLLRCQGTTPANWKPGTVPGGTVPGGTATNTTSSNTGLIAGLVVGAIALVGGGVLYAATR